MPDKSEPTVHYGYYATAEVQRTMYATKVAMICLAIIFCLSMIGMFAVMSTPFLENFLLLVCCGVIAVLCLIAMLFYPSTMQQYEHLLTRSRQPDVLVYDRLS